MKDVNEVMIDWFFDKRLTPEGKRTLKRHAKKLIKEQLNEMVYMKDMTIYNVTAGAYMVLNGDYDFSFNTNPVPSSYYIINCNNTVEKITH